MSEKNKTDLVNLVSSTPYTANQTESAVTGLNVGNRYINIQFDPDLLHSVHNEWDIIGMPTIAQPIPSGIHPKPRNNPVNIGKMIIAEGKVSSLITVENYGGAAANRAIHKRRSGQNDTDRKEISRTGAEIEYVIKINDN